ncbi:Chemotaxis protein CheV (fragment) [Candidatus Desulfosporosinus infrequens]|uniref:Stage 0 sporulation protein A homolog n=1 Tax=Candidatus Desulfosporosinus infrequens TaxID=2043169 RepID=A0A2U3JWZ3_9FIRM
MITDIEMPIMDGLTLTKQIKSNPNLKKIPVILFSSIANEALKHQGLSVGADAQITKPEIDKLVDLVVNIRGK